MQIADRPNLTGTPSARNIEEKKNNELKLNLQHLILNKVIIAIVLSFTGVGFQLIFKKKYSIV